MQHIQAGERVSFARISLYFINNIFSQPPNGLAHLPPIIAKQLTLKTTFSTKWPPQTRAEGGQVEPVLGALFFNKLLHMQLRGRRSARWWIFDSSW
jgi:hypothetical protein